MDVDQSTFHAIQIQPNSRNPYGLDENCVFVSMAYLVSTRSDNVTPHDIVNMSEMMQPADGRGGLEPYDIERLLAAVAEKKRLKYVFQQWSDHRALDEVLESHGTKKVAVLYRRNNKYRTGHCVVWDMDLQGNGQKGYLDFQQAQHPVPCEKDGDEYIDDMLEYYFLFEGRA
ncbi:uncharacterized protein KY384_002063 [Bacidia gigantensis]|uniref:uncharacterized protein n=1 Tax=Bacidia gigantensis TaxID=2732470 RepID=UPI001D04388B|nr:uncharacterized protein KY384_002063 [Bacidia gigantensis]KAG8533280.1 hypothetical protein KY384_002063 [Bacidia gigantensis]